MKASAAVMSTAVLSRVHDRRTQQFADRVQIVGGARHNVARAVAQIIGVAETFEAGEQVIAQVEFDVARDADHDPTGKELEDSFPNRDREQQPGEEKKFVASNAFQQGVGSDPQHLGTQNLNAVGQEDADRTRGVAPAVTLQIG